MGTFREVELDDLELSDDDVRLRAWQPADATRVHEIMADPTLRAFLSLPDPYTAADAHDYVTVDGPARRGAGTGLASAVLERRTGRVVGSCLLRLDGEPEIGYWIAGDARGHGYAAAATRLVANWALEMGVPRLTLMSDVRNLASSRTALTAGFAFEGISRGAVTARASGASPERRGDLACFARLATDTGDPIAPMLPRLPDDVLSDGVLSLRVMTAGDAPALSALDDEVSRYWSFDGRALTQAQARTAASDAGLQWLVGRTGLRLAMIEPTSGAFAGMLSLRLTGPPGVGLLGYSVHPSFRGRGCTTRALRLFAPWAFATAGLARLELGARAGNTASRRAAENAGFRFEGIFAGRVRDAHGTYHDEARYALLNPAVEHDE